LRFIAALEVLRHPKFDFSATGEVVASYNLVSQVFNVVIRLFARPRSSPSLHRSTM
jgi:hypothetical protein